MQRHSPQAKATRGPTHGPQTAADAVAIGGRRRHPFQRAQTTPRDRFAPPPVQHNSGQLQLLHVNQCDGSVATGVSSCRVVGDHQAPAASHLAHISSPKALPHAAPSLAVWSPRHDPRQARRRGVRATPTRAVVLTQPAQLAQHSRQVPAALDADALQQAEQRHRLGFLKEFAHAPTADSGTNRLWVCIRQRQLGGPADVFINDRHVDEAAGLGLPRQLAQQPLMTIYNTSFTLCPLKCGHWHNYPIQFRGDFFLVHEQIEWPNEVRLYQPWPQEPNSSASNILPYMAASSSNSNRPSIRQPRVRRARSVSVAPNSATLEPPPQQPVLDQPVAASPLANSSSNSSCSRPVNWTVQRCRANYNGLDDIVLWLADPSRERVMSHLANMIRQGNIKGMPVAPENLYGRLVQQWGSLALLQLDLTRQAVTRLVNDPAVTLLHPITPPRPPMECMYRSSLDEDVRTHSSVQSL